MTPEKLRSISKSLVTALMVVAACVLSVLLVGANAWAGIVLYWAVLLGKNICDFLANELEKEQKEDEENG